ncbi:MAG TPA: hypothetical protein VKP67_11840 [Xanthobacteraceae bacterium]|nr:hypothetical protein [Xanthobacteraceae bacterium]
MGRGSRFGRFEYGPPVGLLSQNRNPARASWARITFQPGQAPLHCLDAAGIAAADDDAEVAA